MENRKRSKSALEDRYRTLLQKIISQTISAIVSLNKSRVKVKKEEKGEFPVCALPAPFSAPSLFNDRERVLCIAVSAIQFQQKFIFEF
jgi:hypothetical protein